ncbi:hypothetical protein [Nostoc sp.]
MKCFGGKCDLCPIEMKLLAAKSQVISYLGAKEAIAKPGFY